MKAERSGITLLLGLLLLLCSLLGMLHAQTAPTPMTFPSFTIPELPEPPQQTLPQISESDDHNLIALITERPLSQIVQDLQPFIQSESMEDLVAILAVVPSSHVDSLRAVIIYLLEQSLLPINDIVILIVGLADHYYDDQRAVELLFNIMLEKPILQKTAPLYLAADTGFSKAIPLLIQWSKKAQQDNNALKNWLSSFLNQAVLDIAENNNKQALHTLIQAGVSLSKAQLSQLLWHAVTHADNNDLIDYVLSHKVDVNYHHEGHTILMQALRSYDVAIIQKLVDAGAEFNVSIDPKIGTILQLIFTMQNQELKNKKPGYKVRVQHLQKIEDYLRSKGAREVII